MKHQKGFTFLEVLIVAMVVMMAVALSFVAYVAIAKEDATSQAQECPQNMKPVVLDDDGEREVLCRALTSSHSHTAQ